MVKAVGLSVYLEAVSDVCVLGERNGWVVMYVNRPTSRPEVRRLAHL